MYGANLLCCIEGLPLKCASLKLHKLPMVLYAVLGFPHIAIIISCISMDNVVEAHATLSSRFMRR